MASQGIARAAWWVTVATLTLSLAAAQSAAVLGQDDASMEDATGPELLPGVDLETVEVEPGVHQVLGDGIRNLSRPVEMVIFNTHMSPGDVFRINAMATRGLAANENGLWVGGRDGVFRLGQQDLVWESGPSQEWWGTGFDVTPDDRLYRSDRGQILTGDTWKKVAPKNLRGFKTLGHADGQFTADGTYWTEGYNGRKREARREILARRDDDGWVRLKPPPAPPGRDPDKRPAGIDQWGVTNDGVVYVMRAHRQVQRLEDGKWETLPPPGGRLAGLHVGPDGTVWVERQEQEGHTYGGGSEFARFDGDGWTGYETGPPRYLYPSPETVAADGALWVAPGGNLLTSGGCDGIIRIGDSGMDRFFPDTCIYDIAAGPNGEVWLEAGTWDGDWYVPDDVGPVDLFAITPEAWMTSS